MYDKQYSKRHHICIKGGCQWNMLQMNLDIQTLLKKYIKDNIFGSLW